MLKMYSIYDAMVEAFVNPMFFRTDREAQRSFLDEANREDSNIHLHRDHYSLYCVGVFDDDTGLVTGNNEPVLIVRADLHEGKDV